MNEFKLHKLLCELIIACRSSASPEQSLDNLLRYNSEAAERPVGVSEHIVKQLAQQSRDPEKFLCTYEKLKSKKLDYLAPYMQVLAHIHEDKWLRECLKRRATKLKHKQQRKGEMVASLTSLSHTSQSHLENMTHEDIPQVCSRLEQVVAQLQGKKSRVSSRPDRHGLTQLSNWSVLRPFMSHDFIDDPTTPMPPPMSAIPEESRESVLIEDLLCCLGGFQGKYITAQLIRSPYEPRSFVVSDSVDGSLRDLVVKVLPLASHYSVIVRFIQEKRQMEWGRVNQALTAAMNKFVNEYLVFLAQLETQHRRHELNLPKLWYFLQSTIDTMEILAKIATIINNAEARGGKTLSLLHEETIELVANTQAQTMCLHLTQAAAVPYFQSLKQWLHKGIVFDPFGEFMIEDNVSMEKEMHKVTGLYSDEYWSKRYMIKKENVPCFLHNVQETILRTGKYLNVIRQCSEIANKSAIMFSETNEDMLVYTLRGEQYLAIIDKAYQYTSEKLLYLLMTNYDVVNRIKSLKRYFLLEQGDFIVQLLDLCEEELEKPIADVTPARLQTLLELALRTSCGKSDPYKEDVYLTILTQNNTYQIFKIQSIGNDEDKVMEYMEGESQRSKTGLEGFAFQVTSKWPLSLLFNEKIIGCYQMLFRHLLYCKHVDRRLCRVWICDKMVKKLPRESSAGYLHSFSLRQRMLFCVQNLEYYMMEEAIEPNWIKFMSRISSVKNIDDLLTEHWNFLDQCMKDCMFMNHELIRTIKKILETCIEFCDFIQSYDDVYGKDLGVQNQSFEENIARLDSTFTGLLVILLRNILYLGREESSEKLCNILYREDFNNYYSEYVDDDRLPSEILSDCEQTTGISG